MMVISEPDGMVVSASFCGEDAPAVPALLTYESEAPKVLFVS